MAEDLLTITRLSKSFNGLKAVNNISFSVAKGEIFAFLGPNGAGKSTTIKMITTLLHPDSGSIRIAGIDPLHEPGKARETFGIVFQDPSLDDELTAMENLDFHGAIYSVPKKTRRQRAASLLKMVGLWDRRNDLVKKFSGGMKRRLEIARGLLHHPQVLFLDEPTIGLDPQTRNHIWSYIRELNRAEGITVFFTTHYMEEAEKVAGRIAIIDRGNIVSRGTSAEIRKSANASSLEEAFITLTGKDIRAEEATVADRMRLRRKVFRR